LPTSAAAPAGGGSRVTLIETTRFPLTDVEGNATGQQVFYSIVDREGNPIARATVNLEGDRAYVGNIRTEPPVAGQADPIGPRAIRRDVLRQLQEQNPDVRIVRMARQGEPTVEISLRNQQRAARELADVSRETPQRADPVQLAEAERLKIDVGEKTDEAAIAKQVARQEQEIAGMRGEEGSKPELEAALKADAELSQQEEGYAKALEEAARCLAERLFE
jgi:hypothetical protein